MSRACACGEDVDLKDCTCVIGEAERLREKVRALEGELANFTALSNKRKEFWDSETAKRIKAEAERDVAESQRDGISTVSWELITSMRAKVAEWKESHEAKTLEARENLERAINAEAELAAEKAAVPISWMEMENQLVEHKYRSEKAEAERDEALKRASHFPWIDKDEQGRRRTTFIPVVEAQKKIREMESTITALRSELAAKDARIEALEKRVMPVVRADTGEAV